MMHEDCGGHVESRVHDCERYWKCLRCGATMDDDSDEVVPETAELIVDADIEKFMEEGLP